MDIAIAGAGPGGLAAALDRCHDLGDALAHYAELRRWHVRLCQLMSLTLLRDLLVAGAAKLPGMPWLPAAMVSGQLLSPLKALDPELPAVGEVTA